MRPATYLPTHLRLGNLLAVLALCACQNDARNDAVEKPEPPPIQAVLDSFATPTAHIASDAVVELTDGIAERTSAVDVLQIDRLLIDALSEGLAELRQNGRQATHAIENSGTSLTQQPIEVQGDGYLVITRICNGWGPMPVADLANGTLALTAGFTEQGLDSVVWGSLFACKYKLGEHSIEIDGIEGDSAIDLRAYIGRAVTFDSVGQLSEPIVVDIAARIFVDTLEQLGHFTFKLDPQTRQFETIVPLGSGYVVAAVSLDATNVVEVRAANGAFECDIEARRCSTSDGQAIGEAP